MLDELSLEEKFMIYVDGFVKYPVPYLNEFANEIKDIELSSEQENRVIGLLELDTLALEIALRDGIHPVTGAKWDKSKELIQMRHDILIKRNNRMIKYLKG